jgi:hypothetical protein
MLKNFLLIAIVAVLGAGAADIVRAHNRDVATQHAYTVLKGGKGHNTAIISELKDEMDKNKPLEVSLLNFHASLNNSSANLDNYACVRLVQQTAEALTNGDGDTAASNYRAAEEAGCDIHERQFCGDMEVGMDTLARGGDWDGFSGMADVWSGAGCYNEVN